MQSVFTEKSASRTHHPIITSKIEWTEKRMFQEAPQNKH
jgi:hypothetical protein